ncbi:MAG: hypothetical protein AAFX53_01920 [Bacteroidota bacterium]
MKKQTAWCLFLALVIASSSCSTDGEIAEDTLENLDSVEDMDDDSEDAPMDEENNLGDGDSEETLGQECPENGETYFVESKGLISIEFEDTAYSEDWELKKDTENLSGDGYLVWTGNPSMGSPGEGTLLYRIQIDRPGTYQFVWKSSFRKGDNGTEHNDSWLRFPDAQDFYGSKQNGESKVYPKGSGKTPNPNGASAEGWFKIYRSGNNKAFNWQARTSDHDAHQIYVQFAEKGLYTMEVSARSDYHGIDRFLLFDSTYSLDEAINAGESFSEKEECR